MRILKAPHFIVVQLQALSAALLFIRCTAIDPTDKTRFRFRKKKKQQKSINSYSFSKLNYGLIIGQLLARFFRRIERKFLRTCIRRKYVMLDSSKTITPPMEPLLPLPLLVKDDSSVAPDLKLEDISFCSLCDFEVCPRGVDFYF